MAQAQAQPQVAISVADQVVKYIRLTIPNAVPPLPSISRETWGNVILALTLLFLAVKIWDLTKRIRELESTMAEWDERCTSTASNATDEDDTVKVEDASSEMDDPFIEDVGMRSRLVALNREVAMRKAMDLRKRAAMRRAVRISKEAGREGDRDRDAGGGLRMRGR